jgi:hypothetical protein
VRRRFLMSNSERMAEEAKKLGRDVEDRARSVGRQYQKAAQEVSRSAQEASEGFQAIAAEMTEYSKKNLDDVMHAWEQLMGARSFGEMVEIQALYAKKALESYSSAMSRVRGLYLGMARNATKPAEEAAKRFDS